MLPSLSPLFYLTHPLPPKSLSLHIKPHQSQHCPMGRMIEVKLEGIWVKLGVYLHQTGSKVMCKTFGRERVSKRGLIDKYAVEIEMLEKGLALVVSHASLPFEVYWQTMLPNSPKPAAINDLLQAGHALQNWEKNVQALSTEVETGTQYYKIGVGVVKMGGDKAVACHKQNYPYAVFYCHTFGKTRTYSVPLVDEKGTKSNAVAICHTDTSAWSPIADEPKIKKNQQMNSSSSREAAQKVRSRVPLGFQPSSFTQTVSLFELKNPTCKIRGLSSLIFSINYVAWSEADYEGESEPYIGKIIKIWENPDKTKKVKILWFFRRCEILNYLGDEETPENELFLASGEGVGLANVNPLEAIAGKCNVVCISKDNRNPQPSEEELQRTDFVFYRTFDVGNCKILDKIDDKVAGIEVKFIFNRKECDKSSDVPKLDSERKKDSGIAVPSNETPILSKQNSFEEDKTIKTDKISSDAVAKEDAVDQTSLIKEKYSPGEMHASDANVKLGEMATTIVKQQSVLEGGEYEVGKVLVDQVEVGERVKSLKDSGQLDDRPSKKAKVDGSIKLSRDKNRNTIQKLIIDSDGDDVKALSVGKVLDQVKVEEKVESLKDSSGELDDRPSKKAKVDACIKLTKDRNRNSEKLTINSDGNDVKALPVVTAAEDKTKSKLAKDSLRLDKGLSEKLKPDEKTAKLPNGKLLKASSYTVSRWGLQNW
ncbi:hypothetical protein L1049_018038 [Liquidambar formosana]|uniref:BAH domain-containing protein n=1 Tax=Liquidambar formosana TaxID=63359 RepID=A0AAP0NK01_LIQFO